jgi:LAO/AO transport system kinase
MSVAGYQKSVSLDAYVTGVRDGDRAMLARAITLIESSKGEHVALAEELLQRLLPLTKNAIRVGITGVPGAGKSTAIDQLGINLIEQGHRVAVLAVDPSSKIGGGSILGDKTRMAKLATEERAFIRPSPAGSTLGGVARRTRESITAVEAAGFDIVVVETVGVGQSETAVADMVDMFVLMLQPAGGDDLQGMKRGIVELADLILVNKSDGELAAAAGRTAADYQHALRLLRAPTPGWTPEVRQCSALTGTGIAEVWQTVERFRQALGADGRLQRRRSEQAKAALHEELSESLLARLRGDPEAARRLADLEKRVASGRLSPAAAADAVVAAFLGRAGDR